jgi:hypothetical protein
MTAPCGCLLRGQRGDTFTRKYERQEDMWLPILFAPTQNSQAAGRQGPGHGRRAVLLQPVRPLGAGAPAWIGPALLACPGHDRC